MPVRAVLDLNVLISGVLGLGLERASPPVTTLVAALENRFQAVASPRLLEEFAAVLQRPRFGLGADLAHRWADLVGSAAELVSTQGRVRVLTRDPADNEVLECALAGRAEFVVAGNLRHFEELRPRDTGKIVWRGVRVVTPREFVGTALGL